MLQHGLRPRFVAARSAQSILCNNAYNTYCTACDEAAAVPAAFPTPANASKATKGKKSKVKAVANPPTPPADHRELGVQQDLFTTSQYSPGSPLFLPNGTRIFHKLTAFLKAQYAQFGFEEVISPTIYKKSLWEKSGHWENYAADMFSVTGRGFTGESEGKQIGENEEFGLKPMNCPGHCLLFASKVRSFRNLPIRFSDFSPLHRNEISGALSGLTRVRRFHQDDGHIFCRPSQVADEISKTLDFVKLAYETFNLGPYRLALSTRPEDHYIGALEEWDSAENALRSALEKSGQEWSLNPGDGAFYGPKIDIILKDSDGKEHQTATIQLDFQLPKRFELEYIAPAPELEARGQTTEDPELLAVSGPVRPVMIHRAVLGSVERFMALLIEHYNGHWPFWLSPKQVSVITVSDDPATIDFAQKAIAIMQGNTSHPDKIVARGLHSPVFAIDLDTTPRSVKKKVAESKRARYNIMAVIGKNNVESGKVTVDLSVVATGKEEIKMWITEMLGGVNVTDEALKQVDLTPEQVRALLIELEQRYL